MLLGNASYVLVQIQNIKNKSVSMSVTQLKRSCNRKALAAGALALIAYTGGRRFADDESAKTLACFFIGITVAEATMVSAIREAEAVEANEENILGAVRIFSNMLIPATSFMVGQYSSDPKLHAFCIGSIVASMDISSNIDREQAAGTATGRDR